MIKVLPMVMYPAVYASSIHTKLEKIQNRIDQTMRKTFNLPTDAGYDLLHAHEDLGGMGLDRVEDMVGERQVKMLKQGINSNALYGKTIRAAIYRLQHQAGTGEDPLQNKVMETRV